MSQKMARGATIISRRTRRVNCVRCKMAGRQLALYSLRRIYLFLEVQVENPQVRFPNPLPKASGLGNLTKNLHTSHWKRSHRNNAGVFRVWLVSSLSCWVPSLLTSSGLLSGYEASGPLNLKRYPATNKQTN